eukprot:s46_g24.t1
MYYTYIHDFQIYPLACYCLEALDANFFSCCMAATLGISIPKGNSDVEEICSPGQRPRGASCTMCAVGVADDPCNLWLSMTLVRELP